MKKYNKLVHQTISWQIKCVSVYYETYSIKPTVITGVIGRVEEMEGKGKCVKWFDNGGSRWVFSSIFINSSHSTRDKINPQWLLAAAAQSQLNYRSVCVCVCVCFWQLDRKRDCTQQAASVSFSMLPQTVLCYSPSPPPLSSHPFQTQHPPPNSLSLFIPSFLPSIPPSSAHFLIPLLLIFRLEPLLLSSISCN